MATQKQSSKPKARPGRSNSLQRMLDLEKQCMLDRRHAHPTTNNATTGSPPESAPASAHQQHSDARLPTHQYHQHHQGHQQQPPRGRQPPADVAPLSLSRHPNIQSPTPRALNIQKQQPPRQDQSQPQEDPASTQSIPHTSHTSVASTSHTENQRQRRATKQSQSKSQPPPSISAGSTTNIGARLALEPGQFTDLPTAGTESARNTKQDRRNLEGAGGRGLSPGKVSVDSGTAAAKPFEASRGAETPTKSKKLPAPAINHSLPDLKVVTFLEPTPCREDRESVCQSPSWEAYGRRKKEKKEKRKLTKTSPLPASASAPASAASNTYVNMPVSTPSNKAALSQSPLVQTQTFSFSPESRTRHPQTQPLGMDRSAGALASYSTEFPLDIPPAPHTPRSRSSSFSSLFKAPFEFRRPSIDHDRERQTGFIGGIKLEQHRNESQQKALDESILGPGGEIHPAFRRERRSSSPLRIFTSRQASHEPEDRHYPPIAIKTSKNQALLPSEPSSTSDGNMLKKWRERVGLKASFKANDTESGTSDRKGRPRRLSKSAQRDESATKIGLGKSSSTTALDLPPAGRPSLSPSPLKTWDGVSAGMKVSDKPAKDVDNSSYADYTLPLISPLSPYSLTHDMEGNDSEPPASQPSPLTSDDQSQPSFNTADEIPPPPPRKSSKRKSLISLNDADFGDGNLPLNPLGISPVTITPDAADVRRSSTSLSDAPLKKPSSDKKVPSKLSKTHRQSTSEPPSIPYESFSSGLDTSASSKRTLRDAARAAFGRPASTSSQHVVPNTASSSRPTSRSRPSYYSGFATTTDTNTQPLSSVATNSARDSAYLGKAARVLGEVDWRTGYNTYMSTASPPTNSSDDSATDDGHAPDTPDTSRPQSERSGSFDQVDSKHPPQAALNLALPSPPLSIPAEPRVSAEKPNTVELDNVQTAAMKVLAAFPDGLPKRPSSDWRRSCSDSNLTVSFLPKTQRDSFQSARDRSRPRPIKTNVPSVNDADSKSPPLRDLLMAKDESATTAPWPATYLEAARKAAPAAPAPKPLKQQTSASTPNLAPPKRMTPTSSRSRQSSPGPSNLSHQRNQSHSTSASVITAQVDGEPIAKMFVECCTCKFFHDMPSKLYEAMAHPEDIISASDDYAFAGALSMTVKCPWCKHEMSTRCCAGLAAMVYVKERLH